MPLLSSDSEPEDEAAIEASKKEDLERKKRQYEAELKRRRDEIAANEAKWFSGAKEARIEPLSFEELLDRKSFLLSADEKLQFDEHARADVVDHFEKNVPNFQQRISKITQKDDLLDLIYNAHKPITTARDDEESAENMRLYEILSAFQKPIVGALKEMTKIPKEEKLLELETGNVFFEARERILQEERDKIDMDFVETLRRKEKEKEMQIKQEVEEVAEQLSDLFPENAGNNENVFEEFKNISIAQAMNPVRDSSPIRFNFSSVGLAGLDRMTSGITIDPAVRDLPGEEQNQEDDQSDSEEDCEDFMLAALKRPDRYAHAHSLEVTVKQEEEYMRLDGDDAGYVNVVPKDHNPRNYRIADDFSDYNAENTNEAPSREQLTRSQRRPLTAEHIEMTRQFLEKLEQIRKPVEDLLKDETTTDKQKTQINDWLDRRTFDVTEAELNRKVRFEPFDSPENRFRIFVKPGGIIRRQNDYDPDEGPGHEWKEMSLKEGWQLLKERKTKHPMTIKGQVFQLVKSDRKTKCVQRLVKNTLEEWITCEGYQGNLLGRFWYPVSPAFIRYRNTKRIDVDNIEEIEHAHYMRNRRGLNTTYDKGDLIALFTEDWSLVRENMKRSLDRHFTSRTDRRSKVASVLVFTDWRLAFLDQRVLMNAVVKYVPSETGVLCFEAIRAYLHLMLTNPRIEINTIIFAMGGSPSYEIEFFKKLFSDLMVLCTRHVKVHWYAQDWLDGMNFTINDRNHLLQWNDCIEKTIRVMRRKFPNYHYYNVRAQANLRIEPAFCPKRPDLSRLERIYNLYIRHFGNHAGVIVHRVFFATHSREFNDHPEDSSLNPRCAIVHVHDEKNPYKGEEISEEYGY